MKRNGATKEVDVGELPPLPTGWRWGRVSEAASPERNAIVDGPFGSNLKLSDYTPPPGVPVLTTANLRGDYSPNSVRYISETKFQELRRSEVRAGDILVAKIGSCGLTGTYPLDMPSAIIPANLLKMTVAANISRKYVLYYFNSPIFGRFLKLIITATAQPAFNVSKFRLLPFPLAPVDEQERIVAEIEKQFTRLDAGVASLKRVQIALKRYRASVLKAACEGRLVPTEAELARKENRSYETGEQLLQPILKERREKWNGKGKYKEPAAPDIVDLPTFPEGWTWARLEQLGSVIGGLTKNPARAKLVREVPYLRVANVYANELRLADVEKIGVKESELEKLLLQRGDLLIVEGNGSKDQIGRLAIWDGSITHCVHQNHVIKVRLVCPVMSGWILSWLLSSAGRHFVEVVASSTSGLYTLSVNKVGNLPIPLPPIAEQQRIVAEVDRRLSVIEELETRTSTELRRATRLRQAILGQAFSASANP